MRELGHGDLIGRLWSAALCIDDARVSEAHALVSLRGGTLKLLALRGMFAVDEAPVKELDLEPGQTIRLATDLAIEVVEVILPDAVLALSAPGLPRCVLPAVASIQASPSPCIYPRYKGDADAWIWSTGREWRLRVPNRESQPLSAGDQFEVRGIVFRVVSMSLTSSDVGPTRLGDIHGPMHLIAQFETVQIHRPDEPVFVLGGLPARVLSELVALGGPASWEVVAREVWPEVRDRASLRRRWDINLARLRSKLRDVRIRADLIRADGRGNVEITLHPNDRVEDRV